jgi:hypothetical protein
VDARHTAELSLAFLRMMPPRTTLMRGRATAHHQLTVVNRWIMRLINPHVLCANLPKIYRFYFRGGIVTLDHEEPGKATTSLWATGLYPQWYEQGVPG